MLAEFTYIIPENKEMEKDIVNVMEKHGYDAYSKGSSCTPKTKEIGFKKDPSIKAKDPEEINHKVKKKTTKKKTTKKK